jgi:hypothetical protein
MITHKQFLKPGTDRITGQPFQVFLPAKGRNIYPEGESLVLDSYLEKRVLSGELVRAEASKSDKPNPKGIKAPSNLHTIGGDK